MSMLFLFTGIALAIFAIAVALLILLIRSGQLDDLDTPPLRLLADDPPVEAPPGPTRPDARTPPHDQ
jgi:nitrogen fixation-related uncharacterized protein